MATIKPFGSPMQPVAPPLKKQRAAGIMHEEDRIAVEAEDAISKRRAELRRLQQMRSGEKKVGGNVLAMARSQLGKEKGEDTSKIGDGIGGRRLSQQKPRPGGLPKSASTTSTPIPPLVNDPMRTASLSKGRAPSNVPPNPAKVTAKRAEQIARRLDPSFAMGNTAHSATPIGAPPTPAPPTPVPTHGEATSSNRSRSKSAPPERPPPPPRSPKSPKSPEAPSGASGARSYVQRPPPTTPGSNAPNEPPVSTARRDLLRNLRQYADTPPAKNSQSLQSGEATTLLQMQEKLLKQERDKTEALRKIARLEGELQKVKESKEVQVELETLLQLAETKGETTAIKWAKEKIYGSGNTPKQNRQVGFFSPLNELGGSPSRTFSGAMTPITPRTVPRKRVATPHPKRPAETNENQQDARAFLEEATSSIPYEYTTDLATLIIRRPHGFATEHDLWVDVGQLSSRMYEKSANIQKPSTIEVAAKITTDGSLLTLFAEANVRHRTNGDIDWKDFGNVDELDRPLGSVLYIDSDANEKDYSLDDIFEGAVAAREHYCSSILSMTAALQSRKDKESEESEIRQKAEEAKYLLSASLGDNHSGEKFVQQNLIEINKPTKSDACVGTEDFKFTPAAALQGPNDSKGETNKSKSKEDQSSRASPPTKQEIAVEEEAASDVLSIFLGMFFSSLLWIVWTVLVRVPLRIFSFVLFTLFAWTVLNLIWLHFADDHGAENMGAAIDFMYGRPGVL